MSEPREIHLLVFGVRWPPETFIRAKLERLAARGVRVTVACADGTPRADAGRIRVERVVPAGRTPALALASSLVRLAATRPRRLHAVVQAAFEPTAAGRAVRGREALGRLRAYARLAALRPDVVHFEWNTAAVHFHSLVEALGCPSVVSVRGGDLEVFPYGPSTARLAEGFPVALGRAAAVHCVSEAAREEAIGQGMRAGDGWIIRPAVDPSLFRPAQREDDGIVRIVGAGWLHWRKGWEVALEAVARARAAGIDLRFDLAGPEPSPEMGQPSDRLRIEQTIAELGLGDAVTVHGALPHAELRALLGRADVLLHTSLAEGIPNVVLEAMACGLAVVASDVGGIREVAEDGVEALLVTPRDVAATADALVLLGRDPARRRALGQAARARIERELDLDGQAEAWLDLYRAVVARPAARPRLRLLEAGVGWPPETYLRRRFQGLVRGGFDVTVATLADRRSAVRVDGVRLRRLPLWNESRRRAFAGAARDAALLALTRRARLRRFRAAWRALPLGFEPAMTRLKLARLQLALARLDGDVAHVEWLTFAETCAPVFPVWDVPVVVSCHGSDVLTMPAAALGPDLPALFGRVDAVHVVSDAVHDAARRHGLGPTRARIIPSAVDPGFFRPAPARRRRDGAFLVATVAMIRWVKGTEYALETIRLLAEADVPVLYEIAGGEIGRGGELERVRETIRQLGLEERVRLRGPLPEAQVVRLLQDADAYLQASLSEGMPNAILEAMACGTPVVATDVGGSRETLRDGEEGVLVPPRDPRAAADALERLWREPGWGRELARAARARVERERTLDGHVAAFAGLYDELVQA